LKELGFDPILNMPDFETFAKGVEKRRVTSLFESLIAGTNKGFASGSEFLRGCRKLGCVSILVTWLTLEMKVLPVIRLTSVLYQSCIHPEQYSNTLPLPMTKTLHETIHSVTTTACEVLGDASKFPSDWLFSYRWGKSRAKKGAKESNVLPNGEQIKHITVGGRTSAVVESRQKKVLKDGSEAKEEEVPVKKTGKSKAENVEPKNKKKPQVDAQKASNGKRTAEEETNEEEMTPKKPRASGNQESGTSQGTPIRKSPRSRT
jgi:hypothetical protein